MRKFVLASLFALIVFSGCKKESGCQENNTVAPASEEQQVLAYLTTNNITATKHKSNMYYQILEPGTGDNPSQCAVAQFAYIGKFTSGATFEESSNSVYELQSLIAGWVQGIPLIKKGGKIRLFIPPSLAYGPNDVKKPDGSVAIPGGSILIFEITLIDFR